MNLDSNSVIAISGASSGIGAALALRFADIGCALVICARRLDRLEDIAAKARERGARVLALTLDMSIEEQARQFIRAGLEHFGRIDVLVNNAGRGNCASVEDTTAERLQSIFALNTFSLWYTSAEVLPGMKARGSGRIVNISSVAGKVGYPYNSAYVAAKHAVVGFTASLRAELAGSGVTASLVCPAGVSTEWQEASEDASIGQLFGDGIAKSRRIAADRGLERAPLTPMIPAEQAAERIVQSILQDETNDVYTHEGSQELTMLCAETRHGYDTRMLPLFLGMQAAYAQRGE